MAHPQPTDDLLLLQALIDGELDAASTVAIERRLASEPKLAADHARLLAQRNVIRLSMPRETAPAALRARIEALAGLTDMAAAQTSANANVVTLPTPARARAATSWRAAAGAMAAALVMLLGVDAYLLTGMNWAGPDPVARAAVANHMRGVIAGQPVDVVSTDRHTVKPWLAAKVPLATTVVDLTADGYSLAGGRVDIIDDTPAATLVYRYREHVISVTELRRGAAPAKGDGRETVDGHPVVAWADDSRRYVAVSDMPPAELDQFVAAFRRAAANAGEERAAPPAR